MNEEAKQEELVDEGEVVEVDLPEEKPSGKIAILLTRTMKKAEKAIEDVSEEPEEKSAEELEDYSEKVKKKNWNLTRKLKRRLKEVKNLLMICKKNCRRKPTI